MRSAIQLENISFPNFAEKFSSEQSSNVSQKMKAWLESDFAGFRRVVAKSSDCAPNLANIKKAASLHKKGSGKQIKNFVLLGTGGSSLGGETIIRALHAAGKNPQFFFCDNNDPQWFSWILSSLNPKETLFFVVSKSGKTPETISQFLVSLKWIQKSVKKNWQKHFVLCTDPVAGDLRALANKWKITCLDIPSPVGGRFSVLTAVGLFPAAFAGLNIQALWNGASDLAASYEKNMLENEAALAARALTCSPHRPITIFMPYSSQLQAFSRWFCQLWAESLGKEQQGFTPYPATGTTDQHSQMQLYMEGPKDKNIVLVRVQSMKEKFPLALPKDLENLPSFLELKKKSMWDLFEAEFLATRDAISKQGIPNLTISLDKLDEYSLGSLFYFWEYATAFAGALMGINPFDQPGVEAAKILTKKYLANQGK